MIPLALWDEHLVEDQQRDLAHAIKRTSESFSFINTIGSGWDKPNLKSVDVTKPKLETMQL